MSGLLNLFGQTTGNANKDAAINQGLLQMGLQMLQGKGNFGQVLGQGGMAGINGYNQSMDQSWQQKQRAEQEKQWEEQKRRQLRQREMEELPAKYYLSPEQASLQNGKGPTLENAARIGGPGFNWDGYITDLARLDPIQAMELRQRMKKQQPAPVVVSEGASLVNPETGKPMFQSQPKDNSPSDWRLYQLSGAQERGVPFDQWDLARRKASASSVSVNTDNLGLKPKERFEMEGKLGDDYRALTKTDQSIIASATKISEILKQKGALKDQGAIYSFAKMLDPDGAVREADYAAIANTAGGVDRIKNLFNRALTGEQLTETQRRDMERIANAFGKVAAERIRKANNLYRNQASRYNLDPSAFAAEPPSFEDGSTSSIDDLVNKYRTRSR